MRVTLKSVDGEEWDIEGTEEEVTRFMVIIKTPKSVRKFFEDAQRQYPEFFENVQGEYPTYKSSK